MIKSLLSYDKGVQGQGGGNKMVQYACSGDWFQWPQQHLPNSLPVDFGKYLYHTRGKMSSAMGSKSVLVKDVAISQRKGTITKRKMLRQISPSFSLFFSKIVFGGTYLRDYFQHLKRERFSVLILEYERQMFFPIAYWVKVGGGILILASSSQWFQRRFLELEMCLASLYELPSQRYYDHISWT